MTPFFNTKFKKAEEIAQKLSLIEFVMSTFQKEEIAYPKFNISLEILDVLCVSSAVCCQTTAAYIYKMLIFRTTKPILFRMIFAFTKRYGFRMIGK